MDVEKQSFTTSTDSNRKVTIPKPTLDGIGVDPENPKKYLLEVTVKLIKKKDRK